MELPVERATELEAEATIIELATALGYRVHGARPAPSKKGWRTPIKGQKGFPDLVICGGSVLLIVELKRHPNRVEPEQERWLAALSYAGVDARVVWVPEQLDEFCQWLADHRPTLHK